MTSRIVVNNIESDAGVSTVFFNSDIGASDGHLKVSAEAHLLGNVGVGTTSPQDTLHVYGTATNSTAVVAIESSAKNDGILQISGPDIFLGAGVGHLDLGQNANGATVTADSTGSGSNNLLLQTTSNGITEERVRITSDGSVGISESSPDMKLELRESGVNISATGNAIKDSTMKGIHLANSNNNDTSLGLWATTGDAHWSGISFQRNDSENTWGTDIRLYTHEDATNDLTYTRERLRINPHGLLINHKGQNAADTGGSILGRYKYTQINQSQNYEHKILGPDGRKLQDFCNNNVYSVITVLTTGTGTMNMFCQYEYFAISNGQTVNLTHLRGNSGASSNRPYMVLDSYDPCWKMDHSGVYTMDIEVALYGGRSGYTYTPEFGNFTSNP